MAFRISILLVGIALVGYLHYLFSPWEGAPIDEMISKWGAPDAEEQLPDGWRVYTWNSVASDDSGSFADCSQNFVTNAEGMIISSSATGSCDAAGTEAEPARPE